MSDENIVSFINKRFSAVKLKIDDPAARELTRKYGVSWPPVVIVADSREKEHYKSVGFQPSGELLPMLMVAYGRACFDRGRLDDAMRSFSMVIERHADSAFAAEAMYWRGVTCYRNGDKDAQIKQWQELAEKRPSSQWSTAASYLAADPRR